MSSNNQTNQPAPPTVNNIPPFPNGPTPTPQNPNQPPMGSPAMGQPYPPQPMAVPPKQPMDPAKKKKLILGLSIGGGVLVLGIIAAIIIPILLRVDYASSYNIAKELKPKIYDIYRSYDCEYVVDYVDSSYTSIKEYSGYIEDCKMIYNTETDNLVLELENSQGVKKDQKIRDQFNKFKTEYTAISSGDNETLDAKLKSWQAMHNFVVTAASLTTSSPDSEYTTAASYLIDSDNDSLKNYGEGWLERQLAITAAYRTMRGAVGDPNWSSLYNDYNNKNNEYRDWVAANKPDIKVIVPLNFNDTSKMYSEFSELYDLISTTYADHYNYGSEDCSEFLGEVYCD